ncbi:MAG TPA: glycine--tRNA ligase subunit beta [Nevskiaceae bacterium]|nr:glycine--tRNA ligase subunit beta [Nevskiaceae bacterium]
MSAPLLIEIGCEDLPARYVRPLANALAEGIVNGLGKRNVERGASRVFATPRRIAVLIDGVATKQASQKIERKGPAVAAAFRDGQPTPAALGFAKSCGVDVSALKQVDGNLVFRGKQKGRTTVELIPEIFDETLKQMDQLVPKRMRWGSGDETFVRPVQWIVALLGSRVAPIKRFGVEAGRKTFGHRYHAPKAISLKSPERYESSLRDAKVWADFASRREEIKRQVEAEAQKLGGTARVSEDLLDEVTSLVEWPVVIAGRIDRRFLELPSEVVVATVETNQRYFTVFDGAGRLLPNFITVSNIESRDVSQVITGNERVVTPRLTDALFFWEQDLKQPLAAYGAKLDAVTFQKDLGTIGQKIARVKALATRIADLLNADPKAVARAATLCKNDLVTRMVYEFPELQGIMGGYYAAKAGESAEVALAIREHYLPTQAGTAIPGHRVGQIVALADKLDTLAGIFAIGQKPTASKDPFALRRAALGVLRICIEGKLPLDLRALLKLALEAQPAGKRDDATLKDLLDFVLERLRAYYADQNLPVEMFEAVKALEIASPLDFDTRIQGLRGFWELPASKNLAAAHKRIRNILRQAGEGDIEIRTDHFREAEERTLFESMRALDDRLKHATGHGNYIEGLRFLAELQRPVDAFFDKVMVMAPEEDLRANRVALLRRLDRMCRSIADISCLPGQ